MARALPPLHHYRYYHRAVTAVPGNDDTNKYNNKPYKSDAFREDRRSRPRVTTTVVEETSARARARALYWRSGAPFYARPVAVPTNSDARRVQNRSFTSGLNPCKCERREKVTPAR